MSESSGTIVRFCWIFWITSSTLPPCLTRDSRCHHGLQLAMAQHLLLDGGDALRDVFRDHRFHITFRNLLLLHQHLGLRGVLGREGERHQIARERVPATRAAGSPSAAGATSPGSRPCSIHGFQSCAYSVLALMSHKISPAESVGDAIPARAGPHAFANCMHPMQVAPVRSQIIKLIVQNKQSR